MISHKFALILNPNTVAANAHIIADSKVAANSIKSKTRTCGSSLIDLIKAAQMFQDMGIPIKKASHSRDLRLDVAGGGLHTT